MIIPGIRKIARASVGLLAAGLLVGLAGPAAADTPVTPAEGATPMAVNLAAAPSSAAKRPSPEDRKEARRDAAALRLVNEQRAKAGCAPLRKVSTLQSAAIRQSSDQAKRDRMGHDGANGSTINSRLGGLGYSRWAENVAQYGSAQAAVDAWMNSPGHRANILNCAYTETGLDSERNKTSGKIYWTQTFGG